MNLKQFQKNCIFNFTTYVNIYTENVEFFNRFCLQKNRSYPFTSITVINLLFVKNESARLLKKMAILLLRVIYCSKVELSGIAITNLIEKIPIEIYSLKCKISYLKFFSNKRPKSLIGKVLSSWDGFSIRLFEIKLTYETDSSKKNSTTLSIESIFLSCNFSCNFEHKRIDNYFHFTQSIWIKSTTTTEILF